MSGKIFESSSNIYQDQAKVLFDYYKSAAEKIVAQEKMFEGEIAKLKGELEESHQELESQKPMMYASFVLIGLGIVGILLSPYVGLLVIVGVVVYVMYYQKKQQQDKTSEEIAGKITLLENNKKNIFRGYKVNKLGVAYVPVASRVAYKGKSFLIDHTGVTGNERFTLQLLRQGQSVSESIKDLQELSANVPMVETSEAAEQVNTEQYSRSIQKVTYHDYFGQLDRSLRNLSFQLNNYDETNVDLPVIRPNSTFEKFLSDHATDQTNGKTVFRIYDTSAFDEDVEHFSQLNETRAAVSEESEEMDQTLRHLMVDVANAVQMSSTMKVASANRLVEYSNRILFNILKSSYNFYSPELEAEEIERIKNEKFNYAENGSNYRPFNLRESSRMRFDLLNMTWVAEDGSRTSTPFGISQIQTEIIAPVVSNLLKESRKERIDIYNDINRQKRDYLDRWHQAVQDFKGRHETEANRLKSIMTETLSEYSEAFYTLSSNKEAMQKMIADSKLESGMVESNDNSDEVLLGFKTQSAQFEATQKDFQAYTERLDQDIDEKAAQFGYVKNIDAALRDGASHENAVAADNVAMLEERRKPLAEVNPLLAQNTELPPVPAVDDITYEHVGINLNALAKESLSQLDEEKENVPTSVEEVVEIDTDDFLPI